MYEHDEAPEFDEPDIAWRVQRQEDGRWRMQAVIEFEDCTITAATGPYKGVDEPHDEYLLARDMIYRACLSVVQGAPQWEMSAEDWGKWAASNQF